MLSIADRVTDPSEIQSFVIDPELAGRRLDVALSSCAGISRAEAKRWIEAGRVELNRVPVRASARVAAGDTLAADPPASVPLRLEPEPIPLDVAFEDEHVIVIDKPAGLVVHPAPGHEHGTLVHALLHHCRDLSGIGGVLRPGIVHRLDRGTSGVMVAAKSDAAHRGLAAQFERHEIERVYRALVRGRPRASEGNVDAAIGRHPLDRKRMSTRTRRGRPARTRWRVRRRFPKSGALLLEVFPETGRTHQIRVHLAAAGLPIAGDPIYGGGKRRVDAPWSALARPALHAAVLGFVHPISGQSLRFEASLPADLVAAIEACEDREEAPAR